MNIEEIKEVAAIHGRPSASQSNWLISEHDRLTAELEKAHTTITMLNLARAVDSTAVMEENADLTAELANLRAATRGQTFYHSDEAVNAEMGRLRVELDRLRRERDGLNDRRRTAIGCNGELQRQLLASKDERDAAYAKGLEDAAEFCMERMRGIYIETGDFTGHDLLRRDMRAEELEDVAIALRALVSGKEE